MPKVAMDYSKTHFYKIICKDLNVKECYVGHTLNFVKRKCHHKSDCNLPHSKNYNYSVYNFIRENGGWENWEMILIDTLNCENLLEVSKKEREFVENLNACLNDNLPSRTREDWRRDKREELLPKKKDDYHKNRDRYRQQQKENYENNKDEINNKRKTKIMCVCGSYFRKADYKRHEKTKKHQDYINSLED